MSVSPIQLEALVVVSERRDSWFLEDFQQRRETRSGSFFDREDIEQRQPMNTSDLFRMVPGARVLPSGPFGQTVRLRGGCEPALWVDGLPLRTVEGMDDILSAMDLEALEVYHGVNLPVQFGSNPCGAIVAWTRRGEPGPPGRGSFWRRLAFAAGFVTLAFLAIG
jgi:outer membrane cobalamin receptor